MAVLQRKILTVGLLMLLVWLGYKSWQIRIQRLDMKVQLTDLESRTDDLERNN